MMVDEGIVLHKGYRHGRLSILKASSRQFSESKVDIKGYKKSVTDSSCWIQTNQLGYWV